MILAVLSDIHGNLLALQACRADAESLGARRFLVAGDLLTGAPYPGEVLACLRGLDGLVIRGNVDQYLLDLHTGAGDPTLATAARWAPARWTYAQVGQPGLAYLAGLPEQARLALPGLDPLRVVHGSLRRVNGGLVPDQEPAVLRIFRETGLWPDDQPPPSLAESLAGVAEPVLVCGHTHIPWQQAFGPGRLAANPGSVGLPIHGDPRAQYLLLRWGGVGWQAEQRAVDYDRQAARRAFAERGLLEEGGAFARACLANLLSRRNAAYFLVRHWQAALEEAGDNSVEGQERAWRAAAQTFAWEEYGV